MYICNTYMVFLPNYFDVQGYIGEFEIVDDHRSGKVVVNLSGRLNKCGVISPRFDVPINDIEKWTNNLLPSRQFGYVFIHIAIYSVIFHRETYGFAMNSFVFSWCNCYL